MVIYYKGALTVAEQIVQLRERGLIVADEELAEHYLCHVSYYRLAGYWWSMQSVKATHQFKPNSKFEDIVHLNKAYLSSFARIRSLVVSEYIHLSGHRGIN